MKRKLIGLVFTVISVACFIGCSSSDNKDEVDVEAIKEEIQAELAEENENAKEVEDKKNEEEEERIRKQVQEELAEQNSQNNEKNVNIHITDDSKPDQVVIVKETPPPVYYNSSYVFPESSTEYLTESQVSSLSDYQLGIARNEIYARHGYIFKLEIFKSYFEAQSWYVPRYSDASIISLNEIETYNVALIKAEEDSRGIQW